MKNVDFLIKYLSDERHMTIQQDIPESEKFNNYRFLVNIRDPGEPSDTYLKIEDEYLRQLIAEKGITDYTTLSPREPHIYLWQGDITTLKCDAIVNAANSAMTGCYMPCHNCIDNCIHTFAGVRLRAACDRLMKMQDYPEPTGQAKITQGYNLPAEYIIHTVGPIVQGQLTELHCRELESCYRACLEVAAEYRLKSIAFCCLSTGVFGFPQQEAAEIAVKTVRRYVKDNDIDVIFNVFTDADREIYSALLG